MLVVKVGQIEIVLNDIISVVVTVAPRLTVVPVASSVMVVTNTVTDPGTVATKVVSAPVTTVSCGGSVSVSVETMVETGIAPVAAGIVISTVEADSVIVVNDPEIDVVRVEPGIVDVTTNESH